MHLVITIKEEGLTPLAPAEAGAKYSDGASSFPISIEKIIESVNPEAEKILANNPATFLTEEQLEGKRKGLEYSGCSRYMDNPLFYILRLNRKRKKVLREVAKKAL